LNGKGVQASELLAPYSIDAGDEVVKSTFIGICEAGEPLMRKTLGAIRQLYAAEAAGLSGTTKRRYLIVQANNSLAYANLSALLTCGFCLPRAWRLY